MSHPVNPNRDVKGRFSSGSTSESTVRIPSSSSRSRRLAGAHVDPMAHIDDDSATVRAIARTAGGLSHDAESSRIVSSLGLGALTAH